MKTNNLTPYTALKQVFHEPSRMAIVTELCAAEDGLAFADLKSQCALTDGNLNRHLKALTEAGAVRVEKRQRTSRTCTVIHITDAGRIHFVEYLHALEGVLRRTAETLAAEETVASTPFLWNILPVTK